MKLLIIEDEPKTGSYLKQGLTESGFMTDLVDDGAYGLSVALSESYDLIILDVMLPNIDGWKILTALRASNFDKPILMLSAKDTVEDRVKGLDLGADDYLVKPFAFTELLARIRSCLRQHNHKAGPVVITANGIELNLLKRTVKKDNKSIVLTAKEFALLELFLRRKGEILSKSFIASQVWDMNFDSDTNVVEVAIRRLRNKVDNDPNRQLIKTIRGMGYVIEGKNNEETTFS